MPLYGIFTLCCCNRILWQSERGRFMVNKKHGIFEFSFFVWYCVQLTRFVAILLYLLFIADMHVRLNNYNSYTKMKKNIDLICDWHLIKWMTVKLSSKNFVLSHLRYTKYNNNLIFFCFNQTLVQIVFRYHYICFRFFWPPRTPKDPFELIFFTYEVLYIKIG